MSSGSREHSVGFKDHDREARTTGVPRWKARMQKECLKLARKKRESILRSKRAEIGGGRENIELQLEAAKEATVQVFDEDCLLPRFL